MKGGRRDQFLLGSRCDETPRGLTPFIPKGGVKTQTPRDPSSGGTLGPEGNGGSTLVRNEGRGARTPCSRFRRVGVGQGRDGSLLRDLLRSGDPPRIQDPRPTDRIFGDPRRRDCPLLRSSRGSLSRSTSRLPRPPLLTSSVVVRRAEPARGLPSFPGRPSPDPVSVQDLFLSLFPSSLG